jgi:diacylglycerol kinase (ATP)
MAQPGNTGFRRVVNATFYSLAGLRSAWRTEAAFRQECVVIAVLIPVAVWLGQNAVERALLLGSCLFVLIVELLNTAVEFVVDRVGLDRHELSGRAKDLGSAAVFTSIAVALLVWALIAWQRFAPAWRGIG